MKFPFFATFIVLAVWITLTTKRSTNASMKKEEDFLDRERRANLSRKRSLDHLAYLQIPFERFPGDSLSDPGQNECLSSLLQKLHLLQEEGIVNLTGQTNTDLKLNYGVANLETLTHYDDNFATLLITLDQIGHLYYDDGNLSAATVYLEYAVSLHTDVSATYTLLTTIYRQSENPQKIEHLLSIAQGLQSGTKDKILHNLQEALS